MLVVGSHDKHTRAANVTHDFRVISRGRRDRSTFHPRDPLPLVRPRIGFRAQNAVHETRDTVIDRPPRYFRHAVYSPTIRRGSLGSGQVQERGRFDFSSIRNFLEVNFYFSPFFFFFFFFFPFLFLIYWNVARRLFELISSSDDIP